MALCERQAYTESNPERGNLRGSSLLEWSSSIRRQAHSLYLEFNIIYIQVINIASRLESR
jgi:hypothetical protein